MSPTNTLREIKKLVEQAEGLAQALIEQRDAYASERTDNWQDTKGDAYQEVTDLIDDLKEALDVESELEKAAEGLNVDLNPKQ